jgi:four helix bundle protein
MAETGDKGLETLQIWQKAINFGVRICKQIVPGLPEEEKWCLAVQLRRAAQSIHANIAEGYGRYHYLDEVRFCYIARGSLEETFSHLAFANKMDYLSQEAFLQVSGEVQELRRMLNGYITFLKNRKRRASDPDSGHNIHDDPAFYLTDGDPDPDPDLPLP